MLSNKPCKNCFFILAFAFAISFNSPFAGAQDEAETKQDASGLQFQFDDMATVAEFVRANKIVIGRFQFVKMDEGFVVGNLHYPIYNTNGQRRFMVGPLKIQAPKNFPEMKSFDGSLMVRETGKDKMFEAVAYETTEPTNKDLFLKIEGENRLDFRMRFFSDKEFRYEKLIDEAIEDLESKNPSKKFKSMMLLASCGKDASKALQPLRENIGTRDYMHISMSINTIHSIGGQKATTPVASRVLPEIIRQISSTESFRDIHAATTAGKLGPAAKEAIPHIIKTLEKHHKNEKAIAGKLIPLMEALVLIDKDDERVQAAIKPLLKHRYATVRDAAQKALGDE